ncbi:MAG: FAD-dependent oxidoreductase, partial [Bacillota bacterium]|nr:FAD-dependent oxidoreductase [Bacillota bacterium]
CGRVCPQENQCEGVCVRGVQGEPVSIGRLERFVSDWHAEHEEELKAVYGYDAAAKIAPSNGKRVAVVGAGPAGLTCAGDLSAKGYAVTVYESLHKPGGVLAYGIPEFRLPKDIVAAEVKKLEDRGVEFVSNAIIGRAETVDELLDEEGFDAVFVGTGAGLPSFMNIPGENLLGVCSANEYLTRINLMKGYLDDYDTPVPQGKRIAVVGGGNVAMDAARCAMRMGADKVYIVYRRSMEEIPARREEIHHAIEEGVDFQLLRNPVRILGDKDGHVTGIEIVKMELGEPDASGRRRPVEIEDSNYILDVDEVIMSIGTRLNTLILDTTENLEANSRGGIGTDAGAATNRKGVYAGGDAVTGAATVILAMGAGKTAATSIDNYLKK